MSEVSSGRLKVFRGMLMVMMAVAIFSVMDALPKYLARFYRVALVAWARYAFHLVLVVIVLGPRLGRPLVRTARPGAQLVRGLLLAIAAIYFISALKKTTTGRSYGNRVSGTVACRLDVRGCAAIVLKAVAQMG